LLECLIIIALMFCIDEYKLSKDLISMSLKLNCVVESNFHGSERLDVVEC